LFKSLGLHHRRNAGIILVLAVLFLVISFTYGLGVTSKLSNGGFDSPNSESTKALDAINREFNKSQSSMIILFTGSHGAKATSGTYEAAVTKALDPVRSDSDVVSVESYYTTASPSFISKDGQNTYVLVGLKGDDNHQADESATLQSKIHSNDLGVSFGGSAVLNNAITQQISKDLRVSEVISFTVLAILLVIVFRGVVAALVPLLLGGFAILGAFLALRILVDFTAIVTYALNIVTLVGLGLAVDYSLLIVSRFREELHAHHNDTTEALRVTMRTAGRTVFFSGLTVIMSLLGLLVFPLDFLRSMGLASASTVVVAMIAALVVLPALLRLLGRRINWLSFGSARQIDRAVQRGEQVKDKISVWYKTGKFFMSKPIITAVVVIAILLLAGSPFLRIKPSLPDYKVLPVDSSARQVSDNLNRDFGFDSSPITIVYTAHGSPVSATNIASFYAYTQKLRTLSGVTAVSSVVNLPQVSGLDHYQALYSNLDQNQQLQGQVAAELHHDTTLLSVSQKFDGNSQEARDLVATIRHVPQPNGVTILVGGQSAALEDQLSIIGTYAPYGFAIIAGTLFVLLFLMLGSVVIPIKALIQNILSLTASFGALVWIFQDGHLTNFLHLTTVGSIDATQPVLIFAVAFGLSMDYSVFLYSRIKEQYDLLHNTEEAVLAGLQKTGSIITSAAILLFVVVAAFATSRIAVLQEVGVGLALAILIDAFLVRMALVPALMRILGVYNWWAPKFLKRLHEKLGLSEHS
jgi:uncharacterized membrane protein YdfJ with MMPL/SSD domain